ncbi:MAG: PaaI family thioesterase [Allosphingosinicella sp.]|uniref:PaaI family thioesterase n=1 Tax=Allosphingosinicella sp. TaxID=2823234 RepID=UPI00393B4458
MSAEGLAAAQAIFARFDTPPCARTLGWRLVDADPEAGTLKVAMEGRREFLNPAGFVQGGFLAAMLDEAMGPAVLVKSGGALFTPTVNLNVSFLAPARPGELTAVSRVVQLGKSIAYLEAELFDAGGTLVARATAAARLVPIEKI